MLNNIATKYEKDRIKSHYSWNILKNVTLVTEPLNYQNNYFIIRMEGTEKEKLFFKTTWCRDL